MKSSKTVLALALTVALAACGDDDTNGNPNPIDASVEACRATLAAKQATHSADLAVWSIADATEMTRTGGDQTLEADYAGKYRDDLETHPGCEPRPAYTANTSEPWVIDNESAGAPGAPATIAGYPCAAKEYEQPSEDTSKPIVILVHGNSSGVTTFEEYSNAAIAGTELSNNAGFTFTAETTVRDQLATRLVAGGHRVIGFDARVDLVDTLSDLDRTVDTGNPFLNIDHGWIVPMLQSLIKAVMTNNPTRTVSIVSHSLGVTATRDALRRLYNESVAGAAGSVNPFAQLADLVLLSGANHGVSTDDYCETYPHMRGTITCEMGDRAAFIPTYFSKPINGPGDTFSTPCADGDYAFGRTDQCDGNVVQYTTVTMEDLPSGELQDEFVSEQSSSLAMAGCVENELISLADFDASGYFFTGAPGFLANHFGSVRADAGINLVLAKLAD